MKRFAPPYRVAVFTGSRAEFGLLQYVMQALRDDPAFELQVVAGGMHLSPVFGDTVREIEASGFEVRERVEMLVPSDTPLAKAQSVARGTHNLADALNRLAPDITLCMGDRFELLSLAGVATTMNLALAHVSGGEITEGAVDDNIRHAMTKVSHLHCVANDCFAARILQMGEEPWRVLVSGEPGLDAIYRVDFLTREALEADLRTPLGRNTALVTFHPTTRELDDLDSQIEEFVSALGATDLRFIMTAPNADAGGLRILAALQAFTAAHPDRATFVPSLGHRRYLSLLKIVGLVIGNSSSGLVEAPSFNVPVVNIGTRQAGRPQAANVFQTGYSRSSIADGIARARAYAGPPPVNPFGDGHASARIHEFLRRVLETKTRDEVLRKKFVTR